MAYDLGTALNPTDLLDKLRAFLVAQGWTVDLFAVEAPGKRLHMHKGGFYLNAKSADNTASSIWAGGGASQTQQIGFNLSTGFNSGNAWRDQAGVPMRGANSIGGSIKLPAGAIVSYWMDYDDTTKSLILYVQKSAGVWRWMGFGESLIKAGSWTGGAWIASSSSYEWAGYSEGPGHDNTLPCYPFGANKDSGLGPLVMVRADVDSFTGKWVSCSNEEFTGRTGDTNVAGGRVVSGQVPTLSGLVERSRNSLNSTSVLLPVQVFTTRDDGGMSLLGTLPNVFMTNITGLVPGQAYQQGVDWFVPFPGDSATHGTVIRRA
ncbi:hypothetical protein [Geothrix sp. PMB-07]|uniref:hypothetical protein n=1 Tax=Geothrix sp. PMB-07 TaxID=3068640 RepID=UPI0027403D27|nr:hypothetical protein [Geothrix sp. PMB-07]WLT32267.1 hypothetical protein Q9293_02830 [Geothrix sp. PMB-07]